MREQIGTAILIIEDDLIIREQLSNVLRRSGFIPLEALERKSILDLLEKGACSAIVLDLGLPGDDGISIARAIRRRSDIPILMLTGRGGIQSRVKGLDAGADDYMVKPFAAEELVARLRAILRRSVKTREREPQRVIRVGKAHFDTVARTFTSEGLSETLTPRESRLFMALCRGQGPISREAIYRIVFEREWDPGDRSLDVHVAHLRKKMKAVCGDSAFIATTRGEGYELLGEVEYDRGNKS